jgi:transcriptional regulator with XRE-family HTH domain
LRRRVGISREELGFRAEVHRTYISQPERGMKSRTLSGILKLPRALKASDRRLWCGEDGNGLDSSLATGGALHPLSFGEAVNARIRVVPVPASLISRRRTRQLKTHRPGNDCILSNLKSGI